jgi:hypothetical protein
MSIVGFHRCLIVFLSVLLYPLVMLFGSALFAPRPAPILSVLKSIEILKGKFLEATKAFSRCGIDLLRGHARSNQRVGLVRCDQHLTPSFYHSEVVYGC